MNLKLLTVIALFRQKGEYLKALNLSDRFRALNDSILSAQNQSRILELQKRFENTRQEEIRRFLHNIGESSRQAHLLLENLLLWARTHQNNFADPDRARTILRNLMSNAIKFTHPGGRVMVSAAEVGNYVEIAVEDTGTGISPIDQEKLFRIDNPLKMPGTMKEKGSGQGLVLSGEFTEKQGGTISVESKRRPMHS